MNRKGFAPTFLLLVIAVILVLGIGAWYFSETPTQSSSQSIPVAKTPTSSLGNNTVRNSVSSQISSLTGCGPPFDEEVTIGNSVFEIRENSIFVNGAELVKNIPASLGLPPANSGISGVGGDQPNNGTCFGSSSNVTNTSTFDRFVATVDQYTGLKPSLTGDKVAVVYFRQEQHIPEDAYFGVTAAKLLIYSVGGKLLSTTDLKEWSSLYSTYKPYSGGDANNLEIIYFNDPIVYFVEDVGLNKSLIIQSVSGVGTVINLITPRNALYSPSGRHLAYNGNQGYKALPDKNKTGVTVDCGNLGDIPESDFEVMDFAKGSSTLVAFDLKKAFLPVAWSEGGTSVLVLIGTGDDQGCFTKNINFLTYNVGTGQIIFNRDINDVQGALARVCTQQGFDCTDKKSWFQ